VGGGGGLGLNCQDSSRPNESRLLLRHALIEAGMQADYEVVHPSLGIPRAALETLLVATGFISLAIEARTLTDVFADVDALIAWSDSSAFGNFLVGASVDDRAAIRDALARKLECKASPQGIRLERYLTFATARKPRSHSNRDRNSRLLSKRDRAELGNEFDRAGHDRLRSAQRHAYWPICRI
jgi:hypothetical protein